jgi:hypothetical protein
MDKRTFRPRQKNESTDVSSPSIIKIGYLASGSYIDLFIPTHKTFGPWNFKSLNLNLFFSLKRQI